MQLQAAVILAMAAIMCTSVDGKKKVDLVTTTPDSGIGSLLWDIGRIVGDRAADIFLWKTNNRIGGIEASLIDMQDLLAKLVAAQMDANAAQDRLKAAVAVAAIVAGVSALLLMYGWREYMQLRKINEMQLRKINEMQLRKINEMQLRKNNEMDQSRAVGALPDMPDKLQVEIQNNPLERIRESVRLEMNMRMREAASKRGSVAGSVEASSVVAA
jgi:hypothetical protein